MGSRSSPAGRRMPSARGQAGATISPKRDQERRRRPRRARTAGKRCTTGNKVLAGGPDRCALLPAASPSLITGGPRSPVGPDHRWAQITGSPSHGGVSRPRLAGAQPAHERSHGLPNLARTILLHEVQTLDRHLCLVPPAAAELALPADQDRARLRVEEELG